MPPDRHRLFAVTAPGLEPLAEAEIRDLGLRGRAEPGGVAFEGSTEEIVAANLRLRTASRILLRAAEFRARTFHELERHARSVPWQRFLHPGRPVRLRVSSTKSKLYHEGAVAQRIREAIERSTGPVPEAEARPVEQEKEGAAEQVFVVRFLRDHCTLSADTSGALLHRRGYRQAVARAPLRETLAAAVLAASGWNTNAPLLDPFCGSGTIPIEGALLARRIPPGLASPDRTPRDYAVESWPEFDPAVKDRVVDRAREEILPRAPAAILGSDRDDGAVAAARANSVRAGVSSDLELHVRPLSAIEPPPAAGWLVTNPPYGLRIGKRNPLRDLYAALGKVARQKLPGWTLAVLSDDPHLQRQIGLELDELLRTRNGGIPVRLLAARVPPPE